MAIRRVLAALFLSWAGAGLVTAAAPEAGQIVANAATALEVTLKPAGEIAAEATTTIPRLLPGSLPAEEEAALLRTLSHIDNGTVPTGPTATRSGVPFNNMEGELPGAAGARPTPYTEFRVDPGPGVAGAGARRIVVDNASGDMFYTWAHYGQGGDPAFLQIR